MREGSTPWHWLYHLHKPGKPFFSFHGVSVQSSVVDRQRFLFNFRQEASRTAASVADIHRHAGGAERSHPQSSALVGRGAFPQAVDIHV